MGGKSDGMERGSVSQEAASSRASGRSIKSPPAEMILAVKNSHHLEDGDWELRHGQRNISARIEDRIWLRAFQRGQQVVRLGDALRCIVETESHYGADNELVAERHAVIEVLEVIIDLPFDRLPAPER